MSEPEFWGRRARNMSEMAEISARTMNRDNIIASIAAFVPRATDVIISPAGKCGTTLLQQTFHTLRTRGDMDFDDISRVVPWIETAKSLGLDINAEQVAEPRGFKSHLPWDFVPKGAKYIVSLRNPKDAFVSSYRFMEGWYFEPGTISYEEFFESRRADRNRGFDYWSHLKGWWAQRNHPDVLLLSYENMVDDPETRIRRVASFSDIPLDDDLLALTLDHTSRAFMLAYKNRFDDAMMRDLSEREGGLPSDSDSAKVREEGAGRRRDELPDAVSRALDEIWRSDVTPDTGFETYADLEQQLRQLD